MFPDVIFARPKVDSLKIYVDTKYLKLLLPDNLILIDEEGNIYEEFKHRALKLTYNNNYIYISHVIRTLTTKNEIKIYDDFYLLLSSKVEQADYFNGVQLDTIKNIFEFLKQEKYIEFDDVEIIMENCKITDVDICIDYHFKKTNYLLIKKFLIDTSNMYNLSKALNTGVKLFLKKNQLGLEVNHRKTALQSRPYFKIYNKSLEMQQKHPDTFNCIAGKYPSKAEIIFNDLIIRVELTFKNSKHLKHYGLSNYLLKFYEHLKTPEFCSKFQEIKKDFFNLNFRDCKNKRNINELSPNSLIMSRLINYIKTQHSDNEFYYNLIKEMFIYEFTGTQKSRNLKLFNDLYSVELSNIKEIEDNAFMYKELHKLFFT